KVTKRTIELSQINKEMKDILDHMGQAVFTIDRNLCFNAQHSKFAHVLFGDEPFAGRNLLDLLFGSTESIERDDLSSWLQMVFNQTFMKWDDLEAIQPVKTMAVIKKSPDGREQTKFIEMSFRPIEAQAKVEKIMVLIQDITDKKQLEAKMVQQEQAYKDNIDQIVEIIKADQDLFKDFINECREQLIEVEPKLIALRDTPNDFDLINDLFRIMHTIKGNAQLFKLERIAAEAHAVEEIFSSIRKGDKMMDDQLLDDCFSMMDRFTTLFNETLGIYQRIINGKSLDMGRTRTEKRISAESKVVKVKVEDIHHLDELIKTMELIFTEEPQADLTLDKDQFGSVQSLLKETEQQLRALRKVRVGQIFPRFPRMVRDISVELGKNVRLITTGEECMIDQYIFEHIGDPMIHLIRNALDHGVECPEQRLAAGKPVEATVRLEVTIEKGELVIVVQDDGRGLDIERIKNVALDKRLLSQDQALNFSEEEIADLIFIPGFSTSTEITSISGRGVGMDVVKTYIKEKLNGTIILENREGLGLTVKLKIPLNQD
ncbi:MAG TPA: ATP-binding protein, partial [Bacillota bacterium]|nr:ATP-binding protein [Bacillota bacterium]